MSDRTHLYQTRIVWSDPVGTSSYAAYGRDHSLHIDGKADLAMSADPAFRGDRARHNPEELLVASLSSCHMLWYLALCAGHGVVVTDYEDNASGSLTEAGGGRFVEVTLNPKVTLAAGDAEKARQLHEIAHKKCFIANSVNFPVTVAPQIIVRAA